MQTLEMGKRGPELGKQFKAVQPRKQQEGRKATCHFPVVGECEKTLEFLTYLGCF